MEFYLKVNFLRDIFQGFCKKQTNKQTNKQTTKKKLSEHCRTTIENEYKRNIQIPVKNPRSENR